MDKVSIFAEALHKTTLEERRSFLDKACGDDAGLRTEIDALLAAHDDAGSFLQKTPEELAATADSKDVDAIRFREDAWKSSLTPSDSPGCLGKLGHYEVLELIGRGGMGVVLRARDPKLNRVVAIKMLAPELAIDPVSVRRFLREAQAAAAVSHDHVVTIHAVDETARPPIIVMECVDGKSLQEKIDAVGTLDVKSILRIGLQTASGLAAAHRQGLVHRDVKPANILLENGIERVKLTDFGLARAIDDIGMTKTGTITGTPQYMSPEQAQGQPIDHRTDLFSLGCVLYAMCTGRAAFRADSAVAVMHCVVHELPRPIRELNEDIPIWLCEIVEKLLSKNPKDRFASATDVENLLSQHLAHLQQPDSVPQPERISPRTETAGSPHEAAVQQLPGWFFTTIRPWMVVLVSVIVFLAIIRSDHVRIRGAIAFGVVGLLTVILAMFLKNRQKEASQHGLLYSGYATVVALAMAVSFALPVLIVPGSFAIIMSILAMLMTSMALQQVRSAAYAALRGMQGDQPHSDWTIVDKINATRLNPLIIGVGAAVIITPLVIAARAEQDLFQSDTDWIDFAPAAFLVGLPMLLAGWLYVRRRDSEEVAAQHERIAIVMAVVSSLGFALVYLLISSSPVLSILMAVATVAILFFRRRVCLDGLKNEAGAGEIVRRMGFQAIIVGTAFCVVCTVFLWVIKSFRERPSDVSPEPARRSQQRDEPAPFARRRVSYRGSSREPYDPVIGLAVSGDGRHTFVAFRGRLSTGFLQVKTQHGTRTVSAEGVRALATTTDKAAWVGDDGRPHLVTGTGGQRNTSFESVNDVLHSVAWSPDQSRIVAGGENGIYFWPGMQGGPVASKDHNVNNVTEVEWSPDGDRIAFSCTSGLVVCDVTGNELSVARHKLKSTSIAALGWSADSSHLLVGDANGQVHMLDDVGNVELLSSAEGMSCRAVAFSPDNVWILSAETNNRAHYNRDAHQIRCQVNPKLDPDFRPANSSIMLFADDYTQSRSITAMAITPDGSKLFTGSGDGSFSSWEFRDRLSYSSPNARAPFARLPPLQAESE